MNEKNRRLWIALGACYIDAKQQAAQYEAEIGGKPFWPGDQARHDDYYAKQAEQARQAAIWLHTRMMQLDPD